MSRTCDVCARGPRRGNNRSKSMRATPRKININLQSKKVEGKKAKICTSCLRTMTKKAVAAV